MQYEKTISKTEKKETGTKIDNRTIQEKSMLLHMVHFPRNG